MERPTPTDIRDATPAHAPRVIATLNPAFDTDPVFDWVLPDPAARARHGPKIFDMFFNGIEPAGMRLVTPDCTAATLWHAPNPPAQGGLRRMWQGWRAAGGASSCSG